MKKIVIREAFFSLVDLTYVVPYLNQACHYRHQTPSEKPKNRTNKQKTDNKKTIKINLWFKKQQTEEEKTVEFPTKNNFKKEEEEGSNYCEKHTEHQMRNQEEKSPKVW